MIASETLLAGPSDTAFSLFLLAFPVTTDGRPVHTRAGRWNIQHAHRPRDNLQDTRQ